MGILDRRAILIRRMSQGVVLWALCVALTGCGLLIDAVERVIPVAANEVETICERGRVQVGLAVEPFRPFVFPAIWTDEGARVTGLDVELVQALSEGLSQRCGRPVTPVLHLVRFRELFRLLNESQLDLFVSAVVANTPAPARAGVAYSVPYFYDGGISGVTKRGEVRQQVSQAMRAASSTLPFASAVSALHDLTIAVQNDTAAHHYAVANLTANRLIVCDSLPAAFEYADAAADRPIDVILGAQPVLDHIVSHVRKDWSLLASEDGRVWRLTRDQYAVAMAEESYHLRWLVNDVLFQLDEAGRLAQMRRRWLEEDYAFPRRASTEGLTFDVEKMVTHYMQGTCREESPP